MDGRRLTLDTSAPQDYLGYQSLDVVIENSTLLKDASGNPIALEWITPGDRVQVLFYGEIAGGCLTASSLQVIQEQTLAPQE